ncbi:MAG: hypothetical protein Nk1A_6550 [Endomicrobiia bacterium]|nr:MAG: hypothetical protein Nk1A_6550 [Endomicrobiia bacterium]
MKKIVSLFVLVIFAMTSVVSFSGCRLFHKKKKKRHDDMFVFSFPDVKKKSHSEDEEPPEDKEHHEDDKPPDPFKPHIEANGKSTERNEADKDIFRYSEYDPKTEILKEVKEGFDPDYSGDEFEDQCSGSVDNEGKTCNTAFLEDNGVWVDRNIY